MLAERWKSATFGRVPKGHECRPAMHDTLALCDLQTRWSQACCCLVQMVHALCRLGPGAACARVHERRVADCSRQLSAAAAAGPRRGQDGLRARHVAPGACAASLLLTFLGPLKDAPCQSALMDMLGSSENCVMAVAQCSRENDDDKVQTGS